MSAPVIAITRPAADAAELDGAIRRAGGDPRGFPLLSIEPPADPGPLRSAVGAAARYGLVVFTSRNAVDAWVVTARALDLDPAAALRGVRVAVVGPGTAAALERHGIAVGELPDRADAEALLDHLRARGGLSGLRVLLPRGDRARRVLADGLRQAGCTVDEVVAYRNVPAADGAAERLERALLNGELDVVTFASGSAVDAFAAAVGIGRARAALTRAAAVVIGSTTAAALGRIGLSPAGVAAQATPEGLAHAALDAAGSRRKER